MILQENDNTKIKLLNVIMDQPDIVFLLKEKYVDEEIWRYCIEQDPSLFRKMKHPSESLCLYACEVDGANLRYIKNKFTYITITAIMVYTAVKSNPKAILYVPKKLLNDSLKEMAFDNDPSLMAYFHNISYEYIHKIIQEKPYAIQYIENIDDDTICEEIKNNPRICVYLHHISQKILDILHEYYPDYYNLYKKNDIDS